MRDLSLHLLDIVQNALVAHSTEVEVSYLVEEKSSLLSLIIKDNGDGMAPNQLAQALSPFYTSRTTRKEGLGLPLFKMAAELTGGTVTLESCEGVGTCVTGKLYLNHINMPPLGDTVGSILLLMATNPKCDFVFNLGFNKEDFRFSTQEIREILGGALALNHPDVQSWARDYLTQQLELIWDKNNTLNKLLRSKTTGYSPKETP